MNKRIFKTVICILLAVTAIFSIAFSSLAAETSPARSGEGEVTEETTATEAETEPNTEPEDPDNSLPSYYSSRDLGYTTEIKNQYKSNLCWANSASSALELYQKKNTGETYTYSPLQLAYICSNAYNPNLLTRYSWLTSGGIPELTMGYLGSFECVKESYLENNEIMNLDFKDESELLQHEVEYFNIAKEFDESHRAICCVDEMAHVSISTLESIKQAIMDYGCVITSFQIDQECFDEDRVNYYSSQMDDESESGHSVLVVGWDDNYSAEKFSGREKPPVDGAWICQNSWGADAGDGGFIYISYADRSVFDRQFGTTWAIKSAHNIGRYETMYQLDKSPVFTDWLPWDDYDEIHYMNKFNIGENEIIERVNFETESIGAMYKIYRIPLKEEDGYPEVREKWELLTTGTVDHSGYVSVDIPYEIESGEVYIGVTMVKQNGSINSMGVIHKIDDLYNFSNDTLKQSFAMVYTSKGRMGRYDMSITDAVWSIKVRTTKNYRYGDANLSKEVDVTDATLIQKYMASLTDESGISTICADTDDDGDISVNDASLIQKHLSSMATSVPVGELIR